MPPCRSPAVPERDCRMAAEIGEAQSILLPGGGRLGYREFGDPEGVPCVYTPSYMFSNALGVLYDEAAREGVVRWIAVDRAGLGASSPVSEPSLQHHAKSTTRLADHLGLTRLSVVGENAGDSHALATAHHLPDRVDKVLLISGNGPLRSTLLRAGLPISSRLLRIMAKHAPGLFRARSVPRLDLGDAAVARTPGGVHPQAPRSPRVQHHHAGERLHRVGPVHEEGGDARRRSDEGRPPPGRRCVTCTR